MAWQDKAMGLLQDPRMLIGASMLTNNPADRQMLGQLAQYQMGMRQQQQQESKEAAEQELLELRRQTLQHELEQAARTRDLGQQLGGLLSAPEVDQPAALGLLAELDPFQAAKAAGIGARPQQRRIMDDPRGIPRYIDSGDAVFPGIQPPAEAEPPPEPFEGLSKRGQQGWMSAAIARAELKRQQGIPLTQEDLIAVETAKHHLTTPRIMMGPTGERYEYTPGLPQYAIPSAGDTGQAGPALPPPDPAAEGFLQAPPSPEGLLVPPDGSRGTLRQITGSRDQAKLKSSMDRAAGSMMSVITKLNEARSAGENITGAVGAAKALGGAAIARQLGIPMSTRAEELDRELGNLKTALKPIMTGETGKFSDKDIKDLERIIAPLSWKTDEQAIRASMKQLRQILMRLNK